MADDYLMHHGIKGQKWGIRRFQDPNGALTEAGKKHYGVKAKEFKKKATEDAKKLAGKTGEFVKNKVRDVVGKEKKEDLSGLSDQELRDKVNRLRTEADYRRLKSELEDSKSGGSSNSNNGGGGGKKQRNIKKTTAYAILAAPLVAVLATQARKQYEVKVSDMIKKHKNIKLAQAARELAAQKVRADGKAASTAFDFFSAKKAGKATLEALDLKHEDTD